LLEVEPESAKSMGCAVKDTGKPKTGRVQSRPRCCGPYDQLALRFLPAVQQGPDCFAYPWLCPEFFDPETS
ncbi:MAG: hypothetical protein Q4B25_10705, partial [Pseudomonadota bacterium]|nr:hypothetical protein [Pseudomonadota bacterium]